MAILDPACRFTITLFQRTPTERNEGSQAQIDLEKQRIADNFIKPSNAELLKTLSKDDGLRELFSGLGSDQVILAYTFNYKDKHGKVNTDPARLAKLNNKIFEICSIMTPEKDLSSIPLIVTCSEFDVDSYGEEFVRNYCGRLKVDFSPTVPIPFLISTTMDPWTTDTANGDFLADIEDALRGAVCKAIAVLDACENNESATCTQKNN
jgi:hypothetical protein